MTTLINRHLKVPKYLQLAEHLRGEIDSGRFLPDDRLPSLNDLKEQFGANQHTVERAHTLLENDGLIRREPGRGVFVNHPPRRLMTGNIGFVTPYNLHDELNAAYWGLVLTGMRQIAGGRDYHVLLIDNGEKFTDWEKIDGALLLDFNPPPYESGAASMPPNFACLSLLNEVQGMACVTSDDFDAAYQLTRHLIELGHRRIAFLMEMQSGLLLLKERKAGYMKALSEAGIELENRWVRNLTIQEEADGSSSRPNSLRSGELAVSRWLEKDWNETGCTALIAQNDRVALGAIRAFEAAGLNVPRDVSVVGFDGLSSENDTPKLTTIEIPLQEMGREAMTLLLDKLENPALPLESVRLPVRFIQGQTTTSPIGAAMKLEEVVA